MSFIKVVVAAFLIKSISRTGALRFIVYDEEQKFSFFNFSSSKRLLQRLDFSEENN